MLLKDGSYTIFKKESELIKRCSKDEVRYIILDISTPLKGPVHTLVKPKHLSTNEVECHVDLYILYAAEDCPSSDASTFNYMLSADNVNSRYNIYPLIKQMIDFNYYKNNMDLIDSEITIENISISLEDKNIEINEEVSDKYIDKSFKDSRLITSVYNSVGESHVILKNGKWYATISIPMEFDFILFNMKSSESMYLLSYKEYLTFNSIISVTIKIFGKCEDDYDTLQYGELYETEDNYIQASDIYSILETCLYFPQYVELERMICNSRMALVIELESITRSCKLLITEKEYDVNTIKIFDIFNKLLYL